MITLKNLKTKLSEKLINLIIMVHQGRITRSAHEAYKILSLAFEDCPMIFVITGIDDSDPKEYLKQNSYFIENSLKMKFKEIVPVSFLQRNEIKRQKSVKRLQDAVKEHISDRGFGFFLKMKKDQLRPILLMKNIMTNPADKYPQTMDLIFGFGNHIHSGIREPRMKRSHLDLKKRTRKITVNRKKHRVNQQKRNRKISVNRKKHRVMSVNRKKHRVYPQKRTRKITVNPTTIPS